MSIDKCIMRQSKLLFLRQTLFCCIVVLNFWTENMAVKGAQMVIQGKLLHSIYNQLCVIQYGEIDG